MWKNKADPDCMLIFCLQKKLVKLWLTTTAPEAR